MSNSVISIADRQPRPPSFAERARELRRFLAAELKPKGKLLTPFNIITGTIIAVGVVLIAARFYFGLGALTNLSQEYPWGIWIGFDVVTGVAFAGGAYVITFVVHILKFEKYEPIVRATVLNGFLAYAFYAGALLLDLGRPWNVINPIIGNSFGLSSVLFLVAWHFMLYMFCQFVEFSPTVAQWLNWKKVQKWAAGLTTGAVILGITLSTLHQSGLGALFLLAPAKIHPLWWSHYIPVLFFVSSIFAGLSMVIIESTFTHRIFRHRMDKSHRAGHGEIILGLSKGCVGALFAYLFLKIIDVIHGHQWGLLWSGMGAWYAFEILGFVVLPIVMFTTAIRRRNVRLAQVTAFITALGIIINRLNVSVIAFKWDAAVRYTPSFAEVWITLAIISMELWAFRWVVNRMPVFSAHEVDQAETVKQAEVIRWKVSAS
jgi:Ni/Fe-hydrogenase subunit HybB-like protein